MTPDTKAEMVALARRHVIDGRAIVKRQMLRVRALADAGHSTEDAERLLCLSVLRRAAMIGCIILLLLVSGTRFRWRQSFSSRLISSSAAAMQCW